MKFSIVTPSFRSSKWLRLCIESVADQQGVELEHIVQDSCSDDGTQDWLPKESRVKAFIEKDSGMYDAVNRGFRRASCDIVAYLNCDEQYLPGALKEVGDYFAKHPEVDVVFSDTVVTDSEGKYICSRYSLVPRKHQLWVRLPILTSSLFLRRKVVQDQGVWLDTQWRDLGDYFWVSDMVKHGLRIAVVPGFTSAFADTGENMNLKPNALRERAVKWQMAPAWVKLLKPFFVVLYRLRLTARGALFQKPFDYEVYTLTSTKKRVKFSVHHPTSFWKGRSRK
jgi:glycosyltransferase involved in cell wall biosynthesis